MTTSAATSSWLASCHIHSDLCGLSELHVSIDGPVALGVDNSAAIKISEQRGVSKLTKHFAFSAHRIRDEVEHLRLRCIHVDTENQTADVFTKPLADPVFLRHRDAFFGR